MSSIDLAIHLVSVYNGACRIGTSIPPLFGSDLSESSIRLIDQWRRGDKQAGDLLYERYFDRLSKLAGDHLARRFSARFDPEDVIQSAFRTVFRRTREGEFHFDGDADVWRLLVTVSLNKLRRRVRSSRAAKRDVSRETPLDDYLMERICNPPTVEEAAEFAELLESVFRFLTAEQKVALQMRLEGHSQKEIAERLGITDRSVRRLWDRIRDAVATLVSPADPDG